MFLSANIFYPRKRRKKRTSRRPHIIMRQKIRKWWHHARASKQRGKDAAARHNDRGILFTTVYRNILFVCSNRQTLVVKADGGTVQLCLEVVHVR